MPEETIVITEAHLVRGESRRGQFSRRQCKLLGIPYPLEKGWRQRVIGTVVTRGAYEDFLRLKNAHLDNGRTRKPEAQCSGPLSLLGIKQAIEDLQHLTIQEHEAACGPASREAVARRDRMLAVVLHLIQAYRDQR